jgi:hypothetical protein
MAAMSNKRHICHRKISRGRVTERLTAENALSAANRSIPTANAHLGKDFFARVAVPSATPPLTTALTKHKSGESNMSKGNDAFSFCSLQSKSKAEKGRPW